MVLNVETIAILPQLTMTKFLTNPTALPKMPKSQKQTTSEKSGGHVKFRNAPPYCRPSDRRAKYHRTSLIPPLCTFTRGGETNVPVVIIVRTTSISLMCTTENVLATIVLNRLVAHFAGIIAHETQCGIQAGPAHPT